MSNENSADTPPITVKCLTEAQKDAIVFTYQNKIMNQIQLATFWDVSERTINRVLIERGLATPVERIVGEAKDVMRTLKNFGVTPSQLPKILALYVNRSTDTDRMLGQTKTPALLMARPQA